MTPDHDFPGSGSLTWRPTTGLVVILLVLVGMALIGVVVLREPLDRLVVGAVGLVLVVGVVVGRRRRLVAGPRGLLIGGVAGSRIVPWSMVRAIDCGRTKRMGSTTLEIDLVDDELLLFGRIDLGADPVDVAAALMPWFESRRRSGAG